MFQYAFIMLREIRAGKYCIRMALDFAKVSSARFAELYQLYGRMSRKNSTDARARNLFSLNHALIFIHLPKDI